MMHVLFVTGEYPPMQGGVGAYTREISRALQQGGTRISVLTAQRAAQPDCAAFDGSIRVLPAVECWDWRVLPMIPELARALHTDLVHVQYQTAAYAMHPAINFAPRWWKRQGIRVAWTYHDLLPMYLFPKAGHRLRSWVTRFPARSADCVITTTAADRAALVQTGIAATEIPIGSNIVSARLSVSERTARRQRYGYTDNDLVVGFFGFLNQSKGALELLEAIHLLNQMRDSVHLLMIGDQMGASDPTNVAYSRKVEAQIQRYGLSKQIRWTGAMPDLEVAADLNSCDVLLLPFRDGASLRRGTLMAALANGCAIVTTTPQAPIVELKQEREVLYAAVGDSQAMAAAVLRVADDRALRVSLQNNARKVSRRFDWDEIARRHLDLYSASLQRAETDRKSSLFGFGGRHR